jgi:CHAT domain-containing protein
LKQYREPLTSKYAMLIGNPEFDTGYTMKEKAATERGSVLKPLPGAEREVLAIQDLLYVRDWKELTLTKGEAKEGDLKDMIKPNVLHIATHGFFRKDVTGDISYSSNPMYNSGLYFSGASESLGILDYKANDELKKEDGVLTAYEALNLNIDNTNLVVLSACETGLGEIRNGEGVFGLQRAFIAAGARSVVMSLWKVDDAATNDLMVSFYNFWLDGNSKRASLRLAQQQLKVKYPHPYYWGAFVIIGE